MHTVRLCSLLPVPLALSDYEPIEGLKGSGPMGSPYGCSATLELGDGAYKKLLAACHKAFTKGATFGLCPVRRIKAVFFDMDATAIAQESLVELARAVGKEKEVEAITQRAMAGQLDFKAALVERVAVLSGLSEDVFAQVYSTLIINPGLQAFVAFCREIGVKVYLVSGGFMQLAEPLQRFLGIDDVQANTLEVVNKQLTGRVTGDIIDAEGKRHFMLQTCKSLSISPEEVAAVGDGANDIPMLNAAGVAVGYKPKPILIPHLHAQNAHGDHRFLAPLLFGRDLSIVRSRR
jgi:phosphoserine phosphatase